MFDFIKKGRVSVTSLNLKWRGSTHSMGRVAVRDRTFDVTIPFQNKPQDDYSFLKVQKKPPVPVKGISVKQPFKLISVSPQLPIEVAENERVEFKVKVEAPDYAYSGPLEIEMLSDSASDMVHLEISKIVVNVAGTPKDIRESSSIMDVAKGQVFKKSIHLYGIVEIGSEVKRIEISEPFAFVSSDPKIPFRLDNKTGFLMDIFIQAPQQNYGGPLELRFL